ncbi:hypothetical protein AGMMS4952_21970 [Spirochaetia bacterium]|nr:hypothetical protein AGMMS4952_21970 [Spirochaetia bacterium]
MVYNMDEQSAKATAPAKTAGRYFSPLQIGSIAEAVPPVPLEAGVSGALAALRAGTKRKVVPVVQDGRILGLVFRSTLEKSIASSPDRITPPDLAAFLVPPLDTVEASVAIDAVMTHSLNSDAGYDVSGEDGPPWFVVLHKGAYLGVVGFNKIVDHTNTIRVRDLIQAGEIQRNLLDKSKVTDERFQVLLYNKMAHELGGDFYRVFRSGKDRYLVGCFDVAGKNISGSLATMALGACFSALELLTYGGCPEEITRFINSLVRDVSPPGIFITAVLFYVDFTTLTVTIYNCGFSPVSVFVPRGDKVAYHIIQPSLPPLGIQDELDLAAGRIIPIRAGMRLTAYSDGLTDMTNSRRERYGEERTFALLKKFHDLPQRDLRELLEKEIAAWIGAVPGMQNAAPDIESALITIQDEVTLADDVTLVDIRFAQGLEK